MRRACRTRARAKDLDQIQYVDLKDEEAKSKLEAQDLDEEKPGLGQHVSSPAILPVVDVILNRELNNAFPLKVLRGVRKIL